MIANYTKRYFPTWYYNQYLKPPNYTHKWR